MSHSSFPRLVVALSACCIVAFAYPRHPHSGGVQHILNEKDANRSIATRVGDTVVVRLTSNPTTGFGWMVAHTDTKLPVQGQTEFTAPQSPVPGSPSIQIWRFKAMKAGQVKLELHYRRSWEKEPPDQIWRATIKVR